MIKDSESGSSPAAASTTKRWKELSRKSSDGSLGNRFVLCIPFRRNLENVERRALASSGASRHRSSS